MATTTRVSSRGQVVIPAEIRRLLRIEAGDELTVELGTPPDRAVVLRRRSPAEVDRLLPEAWDWVSREGYDPVQALHASRRRERSRERRRRP